MLNKVVGSEIQKQAKQRVLSLCTASWAGSNQYCAGVISQLDRTYQNMKNTVGMAMSMSTYGFNQIMVDVCGSSGDFDEQMCARWFQLAAMIPMMRNNQPNDIFNFKNETWQYSVVAAVQ
jgi:alpha-glucosidase (family GH31 glycosyl hydrolase)